MHGPIPGMAFDHFLYDCIAFLVTHFKGIIVVQVRRDDVPAEYARPGDAKLSSHVQTSLHCSNDSIIAGSFDDIECLSISDLRNHRKRLILVKEGGGILSTDDVIANTTLNGDPIIKAFKRDISSQAQDGEFNSYELQYSVTV